MHVIETKFRIVDEILGKHGDELGSDLAGYRNHVYRMVNFCFALGEFGEDARRKIAIAGCFHDIGIWTGPSFDYLPPSIVAAEKYLANSGSTAWFPEISEMIDQHHKLRKYRDSELVEVFRQGDLVDFSLGFVRFGLPSSFVADVKRRFPNEGFHKMLVKRAGRWVCRHPLNPIPVIKF